MNLNKVSLEMGYKNIRRLLRKKLVALRSAGASNFNSQSTLIILPNKLQNTTKIPKYSTNTAKQSSDTKIPQSKPSHLNAQYRSSLLVGCLIVFQTIPTTHNIKQTNILNHL